MLELIFESHASTTDNEAGLASGWFDAPLSAEGRRQARQLGERRNLPFKRVFCSQLRRSFETAALAFPHATVVRDARLNEVDYGALTRSAKSSIEQNKHRYIAEPYPGGCGKLNMPCRNSSLCGYRKDWRNPEPCDEGLTCTPVSDSLSMCLKNCGSNDECTLNDALECRNDVCQLK